MGTTGRQDHRGPDELRPHPRQGVSSSGRDESLHGSLHQTPAGGEQSGHHTEPGAYRTFTSPSGSVLCCIPTISFQQSHSNNLIPAISFLKLYALLPCRRLVCRVFLAQAPFDWVQSSSRGATRLLSSTSPTPRGVRTAAALSPFTMYRLSLTTSVYIVCSSYAFSMLH